MNGFLTDLAAVVHVMNAVAAGTTNQNSSSVDMTANGGYDAIRFVADIGALTATQVTSMKLQSSPDNATWTDITSGGTAAMADTDSNKCLVADVIRPGVRYIRAVVLRGTANAVINCVIAELYRARTVKITQDATVSQSVKVGPLV